MKLATKKPILKFALAMTTAVTLTGVALVACDKDDDKADKRSDNPQSENQVPANFANSVDEQGYKGKLTQMGTMLRSADGLDLRGQSAPNGSAQDQGTTDANVPPVARMAVNMMLSRPAFKTLRQPFAKLMNSNAPSDDASADGTVSQDSPLFATYQVGDDCSALMFDLSDNYRSTTTAFTSLVNQIAAVDWSKSEYMTKLETDAKQEAFAYAVKIDNTNLNLTDSSSNSGGMDVNGQFGIDGRFSGGANDKQVMFKTSGTIKASQDGSNMTGAMDFNAFSDLPQNSLAMAAGLSVNATADGQSLNGQLKTIVRIVGGATPSFSLGVDGGATSGADRIAGNLQLALSRLSATAASLEVSMKMTNGHQSEEAKQMVEMAINDSTYGYETCRVTAVR